MCPWYPWNGEQEEEGEQRGRLKSTWELAVQFVIAETKGLRLLFRFGVPAGARHCVVSTLPLSATLGQRDGGTHHIYNKSPQRDLLELSFDPPSGDVLGGRCVQENQSFTCEFKLDALPSQN